MAFDDKGHLYISEQSNFSEIFAYTPKPIAELKLTTAPGCKEGSEADHLYRSCAR